MAISFELGEDLQDIVDAVHAFAEEQVRPRLHEAEREGIPDDLAAAMHELGLTTLVLPESVGGLDSLDLRAATLVSEELAWGDLGVAAAIPGARSAGACVLELGTPEQVARLLGPFGDEGEGWRRSGTLAFVEGPFGISPAAVETTATKDGDAWVLRGRKRYVWAAETADLTVVLARDPQSAAPDPWDRLVLLAVSGRPSGLRAEEADRTLGLRAARHATLHLEGVRVPAADRLGTGAPGELRAALQRVVARKRVLDAARLVGCMRAASEYAFKYATERQTFGVYLYEHQALAFMMADMATLTEGARNLVWRAAAALDKREAAGLELARQALDEAMRYAREVSSDAVQVLGGHGYIQDHPVEKWMRDARTVGLIDGIGADEEDL
ncbi:MAG: acyl-CoA dehydrogenase family protein [Planctomycetota bacterium]